LLLVAVAAEAILAAVAVLAVCFTPRIIVLLQVM
tara:strand:- start:642 stop:743 length:102 start_codon:yes stop_codon:yes gene_type:complete